MKEVKKKKLHIRAHLTRLHRGCRQSPRCSFLNFSIISKYFLFVRISGLGEGQYYWSWAGFTGAARKSSGSSLRTSTPSANANSGASPIINNCALTSTILEQELRELHNSAFYFLKWIWAKLNNTCHGHLCILCSLFFSAGGGSCTGEYKQLTMCTCVHLVKTKKTKVTS